MGRMYAATFQGTLTTAGGNADLFSIQPADDKPVKLRGFSLSQTSEVGDAAEEGLRITVKRLPATFTVGSGGSAVTPAPMDSADVAFGGTVRANDTTVATTSGSAVTLHEMGWNIRNAPFEWWAPDERFAPKAKQGEGLVIVSEGAPADDISIQITAWLEEE